MIKSMGEKTRFADNAKDAGIYNAGIGIPTNGLILHCPFSDVAATHAVTGQALTYTGVWKNWKCAELDAISMMDYSTNSYIDAEVVPASDGTYFEDIEDIANCTISFWVFDFAGNYDGESYYFQPCYNQNDPNTSYGMTWRIRFAGTSDRTSYFSTHYNKNYDRQKYVWHHMMLTMTRRQVILYCDNEAFSQFYMDPGYCKMYRWLFMRRVFGAMRDFRLYNRPVTTDERQALWLEHADSVIPFNN